MSTVTSVFLVPTESAGCHTALSSALGLSFAVEHEGASCRYSCYCLGLSLVLFTDHGLVNDLGIDFEDYSHELDVIVDRAGVDYAVADALQQDAARFIFEVVTKRLKWKAALVFDFQKLLDSFASSEPGFSDRDDGLGRS